ncbi:MAG: DUF362 domain-containing protein [Bacillota bacterium]|jgi:uncharacterized Fe-S center protein|nr:DUF362 domain-containing protein [Bacillota bacterium]
MASTVYFASARDDKGMSLAEKLSKIYDRAGLAGCIAPGDLVAIKVHVGEPGNLSFMPPQLVKVMVDKVTAVGATPFLTDANTLYTGGRSNAADHVRSAISNGFGYAVTGAPFIVADGLLGWDAVTVPIRGRLLKEAKIASAIFHADAMIVVSHFKGHELTGFGGAIKNLGMGCACRQGKQVQHSEVKPRVKAERCIACRRCVRVCPAKAITIVDGKARIDHAACIGCAECVVACRNKAIRPNWDEGAPGNLQRRMAEYALGAVAGKEGKCGYVNVAIRISPNCDCNPVNDVPVVPDIGIMASLDPVAIDAACADMVLAAAGAPGSACHHVRENQDKFRAVYRNADWRIQLEHAEAIGLGTREYRLVQL